MLQMIAQVVHAQRPFLLNIIKNMPPKLEKILSKWQSAIRLNYYE